MGACNFVERAKGVSPRDVFECLRRNAEFEYGNDPYNGTISTCSLSGSPHKVSDRWNKTAEKKAMQYIKSRDYGSKWYAEVVDAGVVEYEICTLKRVQTPKADAQFQTRYGVYVGGKHERDFPTAAAANAYVRDNLYRYAGDAYAVEVKKHSVRVKGNHDTVTRYEQSIRVTKTRPKRVPKGAVVREVHMWYFYGWASC